MLPIWMAFIKLDGAAQPLFKRNRGHPIQLMGYFLGADRIAQVMSRTVSNKFNQSFGATQLTKDHFYNSKVFKLLLRTDMIDLTVFSFRNIRSTAAQ